jgi:hypothetical protein
MIYTHVLKMGGVRSAAHSTRWLLARDHKADLVELHSFWPAAGLANWASKAPGARRAKYEDRRQPLP